MATLTRQGAVWVVSPGCSDEAALLDVARSRGGLELDGARYAVDDRGLLLPGRLTEGAATRRRLAFEAAAVADHDARGRRSRFRVVE